MAEIPTETGGYRKSFTFPGRSARRVIAEANELLESQMRVAQEFEVCRMVWEMKFCGMGPTEIERTLRGGPSWQWRSVRQVENMTRIGDWRFYPEIQTPVDEAGD